MCPADLTGQHLLHCTNLYSSPWSTELTDS